MMRIWLDDERDPPDENWCVARTGAEFLALIQFPDLIGEVSFDHDLGDGEPSGSTLCSALLDRLHDYGLKMPTWHVHSANPCGAKNIESKILSYIKITTGEA